MGIHGVNSSEWLPINQSAAGNRHSAEGTIGWTYKMMSH